MFTVFVVDDDAIILDEIVQTVPWLDNGFEVVGFTTSPVNAVEMIATAQPDVVFSDLRMPEMDGIEMMQALGERGVKCAFVMLSAYGTFQDSRRFFKQEGFDYLLKPLQQKEVQFVLEALAQKLAEKTVPEPINEASVHTNPAFQRLVEYLNENYTQKHTLESLSKQFNVGTNYVCNLFSKHYNTTLTRYITSLRMQRARQLMQETGMAYKAIAIDCGYPDYYYFCRVFKEYYGTPPTDFMRSQQPEPRA